MGPFQLLFLLLYMYLLDFYSVFPLLRLPATKTALLFTTCHSLKCSRAIVCVGLDVQIEYVYISFTLVTVILSLVPD